LTTPSTVPLNVPSGIFSEEPQNGHLDLLPTRVTTDPEPMFSPEEKILKQFLHCIIINAILFNLS